MTMTKKNWVLAAHVLVVASALVGTAANAKGCNGVVDQLKWGCAAWDNNNGPQFPNYKAPNKVQPAVAVATKPAVAPNIPAAGLVPKAGAKIVASGGGNIVASGGGNIVASGGGNLANPSKIISTNGGGVKKP